MTVSPYALALDSCAASAAPVCLRCASAAALPPAPLSRRRRPCTLPPAPPAGVEIIPNEQGNRTTPSYVAFTDTERLIGDAAKNQVGRGARARQLPCCSLSS